MSPQVELAGLIVGFLCTLAIFSYLMADNPLYRAAIYLLVGLAVGYATIVALDSVIIPWIFDLIALTDPESQVNPAIVVPPVILAIILMLKISPRTAPWGNVAMAIMVGIGAAVAVGGAVMGTILPLTAQTIAPTSTIGFMSGIIILVGTILGLLSFFYGTSPIYFFQFKQTGPAQQNIIIRGIAMAGQFFILITLAALYVGALSTSFILLGERFESVRQLFQRMAEMAG